MGVIITLHLKGYLALVSSVQVLSLVSILSTSLLLTSHGNVTEIRPLVCLPSGARASTAPRELGA